MIIKFERIHLLKFVRIKCRFNSTKSVLSNENVTKIKEFRKITNLSVGTCKDILSKNEYNIKKGVNYIFKNFNKNYENKEKKLTEGYYCLLSKGNLTAITELNSYNDLVSENIFFKELLINLCNKLIDHNGTRNLNGLNLDKEIVSDYLHLFYKENKINIDKMLKNVEHINIFKHIYFKRSISQLINYTSYILNDYIFLRKYLLLDLDNLCSRYQNMYIIKKKYHHKETKIEDFILCKGFSFSFLFIKSDENIPQQTKIILEKLALLICINALLYKSKRCSISNGFDIQNCFYVNYFGASTSELEQKEDTYSMRRESEMYITKVNSEIDQGDDVQSVDFMQNKVQSFCILYECLKKMDHKWLRNISKENITFIRLIKLLEDEFKIKIFVKIMYSMLNEDILIL
ncbi:hypothetical protein, conserved [Plasmodium gonderi]|uniref:Elongation factor Ts, mitochondrial n=1 Tax=Plasmodium gonderi TaxID=77519 RepID=A0A1Y1JM38_PLAGO|nr:hypothetical protein, conserved [Plasmodium gonderi]GAW82658.1 hypothetical protein, conserved [Plasmodium gonderi]